jgi:cytochrome c556
MRAVPLIVLAAALLGFTINQDRNDLNRGRDGSGQQSAAGSPCLMAETQPAKATSVDDEIKALNLKNINLGSGMKTFESTKMEDKLRGWASSGATDFADPRKFGVQIAATAKAIDWKKNRKRTKDPEAFDKFASDLEAGGRKIAEAAGKKDSAELKTAAQTTSQVCSGCHSKFNSK